MGRAFKVPKKSDSEQWAKIRALWFAGFRFVNHTRWQEVEAFPERLQDVEDFIRRQEALVHALHSGSLAASARWVQPVSATPC